MAVNIMGLLPSGRAPAVLKAEISEMIAAVKSAPVAATDPAVILASGTVELADGKTTATFHVTGDVTYASGISWVGVKPGAGFRGAVALIRVVGGGVLGAAAANAVSANTGGNTPAPVTPAVPPAPPVPPTPMPAVGEKASYNFTWAHGGWYKTGVLGRYFKNPDADNFVEAWEYPRADKTWEPISEGEPTYAPQPARVKTVATAGAPIGEGDAWVFTTAAPLSGFDSVFIEGGGTAKVLIQNGKYSYGNYVDNRNAFGTAGTEYANGSWNAVDVQAGDKLEIKRSEGYAIGSVIRANGTKEQIFAFKYNFMNSTVAGFQGWNFQKIKAELIRAAA